MSSRTTTPPVPHSVWDVLVLGRAEETVKESGSSRIKFGILATANPDVDRLGLGYEFLHKEHEHQVIGGCGPIPKKEHPEATETDLPDEQIEV